MTIAQALARTAVCLVALVPQGKSVRALDYKETPMFEAAVTAGKMPAVADRLPRRPSIVSFDGRAKKAGRHGGELRTAIIRAKDVRLLVVYGYARLVGYNERFEIVPDILEDVKVEAGRIFTFRLRKGHKWSDGHPFTARDFQYYWEDVANNKELSPNGLSKALLVDGQPPTFEILDNHTIRYSWAKPNPFFLPLLAGAAPLFIYRPAHYLGQFHKKYTKPETLEKAFKAARKHNWASLHNQLDNMYRFDNPDLPTLQPWVNTTRPPTTRFIAVRNPYFHRVDTNGRQLPYIDKINMQVTNGTLIPAKAGTGDLDLQSRGIFFKDYTFLRENEKEYGFKTYLWRIAKGSQIALFPNLNANDAGWRMLFRDVRFRRALSLAIDRSIVNETMFFGLAMESNNTVLPASPLFRKTYQTAWTEYDPDTANDLLDEIGLTKRSNDDIRLMPDGRRLEIIVETAGEDTEQTDVLQLVKEDWREIGVKLFIKPTRREVLRNRVFAGETLMSVWTGLENGVPTLQMSPGELAPTRQQQLQWSKWGQYHETNGRVGEAPDLAEAIELKRLNRAWLVATGHEQREAIWHKMLEIFTDQVYTIGLISGVQKPIVVTNELQNVPEAGIYNWEPGALFGIYRPDTFWFKR